MGFCIYNNVAVGAHYLISKYKYNKIAIFDPDVHHGNGVQDIFYDNPKVLYLSTHPKKEKALDAELIPLFHQYLIFH